MAASGKIFHVPEFVPSRGGLDIGIEVSLFLSEHVQETGYVDVDGRDLYATVTTEMESWYPVLFLERVYYYSPRVVRFTWSIVKDPQERALPTYGGGSFESTNELSVHVSQAATTLFSLIRHACLETTTAQLFQSWWESVACDNEIDINPGYWWSKKGEAQQIENEATIKLRGPFVSRWPDPCESYSARPRM